MGQPTAGPYTADGLSIRANGTEIAKVRVWLTTFQQEPSPAKLAEAEATAALLAAAPALRDALREMLTALDGRVHSNRALAALQQARAALAAADGEGG